MKIVLRKLDELVSKNKWVAISTDDRFEPDKLY